MTRDIAWEFVDRTGSERLALRVDDAGFAARGTVVVDLGGTVDIRYEVHGDAEWRVREARVSADAGGTARTVELERRTDGTWQVDGIERADLAGCTDVDIMVTPFTNTLPVRRIRWRRDEPVRLRVAYVALPHLAVSAAEQEYTALDDADPPRRMRYRGLGTGFEAELTLDADGLVVDYGNVWRRR